jgi:hypothetical protein
MTTERPLPEDDYGAYEMGKRASFQATLKAATGRTILFACFVLFVEIAMGLTPRAALLSSQSDAAKSGSQTSPQPKSQSSKAYSGMYTFLKEGEFVQVTVEDDGRVTGFISRFGEGESDKGSFLDQFFKTAKLDGDKLEFTTQIVHGVSFDFKGTVERGEGKNPGDEAYYVLKGSLTENDTDANKKVTSHSQDVAFKMFPPDAGK